jgi:hypothetical protein
MGSQIWQYTICAIQKGVGVQLSSLISNQAGQARYRTHPSWRAGGMSWRLEAPLATVSNEAFGRLSVTVRSLNRRQSVVYDCALRETF